VDQDFALVVYNGTATINNCTFSLDSTGASFASAGGSSNVQVAATGTNCTWTAVSNGSFVTITSTNSGLDSGTVSYTVASNTLSTARSGTMTIAGQTFTVNQSGACLYSLTPSIVNLPAAGSASKSVKVKTSSDCAWTAVSNDSFITITAGPNGVGNGTVRFAVPGNTNTAPLSGTMTIAGQTVTVNQAAGGCVYGLSATKAKFSAAGGTKTVNVKARFADCAWTAASNDPFITIITGTNGVGKGVVGYSVAANTNLATRLGTMTIAGQAYIVTQSAAP